MHELMNVVYSISSGKTLQRIYDNFQHMDPLHVSSNKENRAMATFSLEDLDQDDLLFV
jgi:hypothetical protein